jgi:hypothetical protein
LLFALTTSVAPETDPKTGKNKTTATELIRTWFLARPLVLRAARVLQMQNWFMVALIMFTTFGGFC